MIYKKNLSPSLKTELFENPTSEYRGMPFWGWNCKLSEDELTRQIDCLKEMGFGGFYMHARTGLNTKYLGKEFMELVGKCTDKAKKEQMSAGLYDEDRWPSGYASGYVTKNPKYRQRRLQFTIEKRSDAMPKAEAIRTGGTYLLSMYDICLNARGELIKYPVINEYSTPEGTLWYAYVTVGNADEFYHEGKMPNDPLNKNAVKRFIEITHEAYKKQVGNEFASTIPAMFTDEPNKAGTGRLLNANSQSDVFLVWTNDFNETYKNAYGEDLINHLPELLWELPQGEVSAARYKYYDHMCQRFVTSYCKPIADWCKKNGLMFTGHLQCESTLGYQSSSPGEMMRCYRAFDIPGIDMLSGNMEYATAKQAQSAARQYGREGVMSELYGATNWDFDFRGHKFHGDWQAAMGVTFRVPHHALVSLKGNAKRDYPASINYQSPWYKEYPYIENHFARLNTVLTRGKPCVSVGVIHPIESYWLHRGPVENTNGRCNDLEEKFRNIISWLLFEPIDFDLISESCLPELCTEIGTKLTVGEMNYSVIIVPGCETLRTTTLNILGEFIKKGGKVIFMGECPKYSDAVKSSLPRDIYEASVQIPFSSLALIDELKSEKAVRIKDGGKGQLIYQMRKDGDSHWLFVANGKPTANKNCNYTPPPTHATIEIKGEFTPRLYDTMTGKIRDIPFNIREGCTIIDYDFHDCDSLLVRLNKKTLTSLCESKKSNTILKTVDIKGKCTLIPEEENVCLMDMAEFAVDGGEIQPMEEILRLSRLAAGQAGIHLTPYIGSEKQPWTIENQSPAHYIELYFEFQSEFTLENSYFCAEELLELSLNGNPVPLCPSGYYVDKSIIKYPLPAISEGRNIITAKMPLSELSLPEPCYLTGNFRVRLEGVTKTLMPPSGSIAFGDICSQGMPFYGGNLTYRTEIDVPEGCDLLINISKYIGSLVRVSIDGTDAGRIVFAPYELTIDNVSEGKHTLEFKLFGNRYNTFGALHNCGDYDWYWPGYWFSKGDSWCYEYNLKKTGIIKSPVIKFIKK